MAALLIGYAVAITIVFFASRLWGRSPHWVKVKPKARAVTREAEEDWGR